ncbi:MAG TPA: hypothetical protein PKK12_05145 [Candidatus Aminicenantes bacterium]|nr:hypothetical protein [Candidatus Aminicenantes bacterium]
MVPLERRRNPRTFFTQDDALTVVFQTTPSAAASLAFLLSLSRSGIGLVTAQTHVRTLNIGDRLLLTVEGLGDLIPAKTPAFIRYLGLQEMSGKASIGLEWAYLPPAVDRAVTAMVLRRNSL